MAAGEGGVAAGEGGVAAGDLSNGRGRHSLTSYRNIKTLEISIAILRFNVLGIGTVLLFMTDA